MEELTFKVQGSAPEPYEVIFARRSPSNLFAYCSCPAGESRQYCKHRLAILDGVTKGIVSPSPDEIKIVQSWLSGTDAERALLKMRNLEKEAAAIKKELSVAKKDLAKAMRD